MSTENSQSNQIPPSYDETNKPLHIPADGLPTDVVGIPMINVHKEPTLKNILPTFKKRDIEVTVNDRKMTRDFYLKHYAHNSQGEYIGTAARALDADLVFIPSKSSPEELKQQFGRLAHQEHQKRGIIRDKDWDPSETGPDAHIKNVEQPAKS